MRVIKLRQNPDLVMVSANCTLLGSFRHISSCGYVINTAVESLIKFLVPSCTVNYGGLM